MANGDITARIAFDFKSAPEEFNKLLRDIGVKSKAFRNKEGKLSFSVDDKPLRDIEQTARRAGTAVGDQLERGAQEGKQALGGLSQFAKSALTFGAVTVGVNALAGAVNELQGPFVELDKQVRNIGTLGTENFQQFTDLALEASTKIPDSAASIAAATYNAISAGISGTNEEIIGFVEEAGKAAVAGVSDIGTAVNAGTSILNAYKLEADDSGQVFDTFFATIKAGKTDFGELNSALANVIPTASASGISFQEVGAALAQMTSLAVPTVQASTKLNQVILELRKPGADLAAVMNAAGLSVRNISSTIQDQGLIATLQQIEMAATGQGKALDQVFSSSEAASAALLVTEDPNTPNLSLIHI